MLYTCGTNFCACQRVQGCVLCVFQSFCTRISFGVRVQFICGRSPQTVKRNWTGMGMHRLPPPLVTADLHVRGWDGLGPVVVACSRAPEADDLVVAACDGEWRWVQAVR